jgi:C4-type Zn-finger protein
MTTTEEILTAETCPTCGETMTFQTKHETVACGPVSRSVPIEAWWCDHCGEAIFEHEILSALDFVLLGQPEVHDARETNDG